jgi:agmatine/peptidylarginine deiminase
MKMERLALKSNREVSPSWWLVALAVSLILELALLSGCNGDSSATNGNRAVPQSFSSPNADAHFKITPPIELSRLANEWEPQQALILSLSFSDALEDLEDIRRLASILNIAHDYLDIYVFGDQEEYKQYAQFLALISQHPRFESILERTHFIDSRKLLRWVRDFGPVFGFGIDGQLVTIDPVFRDFMKPLEEKALHTDEPLNPLRDLYNLHGDAMPSEVAALLQTEFNRPVAIARPPVSMDGGDFISDGQGNVFISRQTLVRNGGNRAELESVFQRYFGAKQLHILEALPGRTVPHLDMIVKFLDRETIVLPDFKVPEGKAINPYLSDLNRKVRRAIDKNETYLRGQFPNYKILKVPMPPILFKSREEIVAEAKQTFVKAYALEKSLVDAEIINLVNDTQLVELERQVLRTVKQELPSADFSSAETFDAVLRHYGQVPLDVIIDRYSEPATRYRSYINSVFLHAKDGRQAFLVPKFTSSDSRESALLKEWEAEVEMAYRTAWPEAKIYWINCDSMVSEFGFLHCATLTVPLLERN